MSAQSKTSPDAVSWNDWGQLDVPEIGSWDPELRVSVVLPHYERHRELERTLAALAAQTYPAALMEVVVADDGSRVTPTFPDGVYGMKVRVVAQEDEGFRAAQVRNLGAREATGDLLLFLDCDMIPESVLVEAHARWHRSGPGVVTLGRRRHVEVGALSPDDIHAAARAGEVGSLFDGLDQQVPTWMEGHFLRTRELRSRHDDLFRVVATGNLGVSRSQFWAVGGLDESFRQWGAEDTELGYRLFIDGAVLVPDRQALCWHQGHGHEPSESERRSLEQQRAKIAHLIAHRGFRHASHGRSFKVPQLVVEVVVDDEPLHAVVASLESILASDFTDLIVHLRVKPEHPDLVVIERSFGGDLRVTIDGDRSGLPVPYVMRLRPGVTLAAGTLGELLRHLTDEEDPVGVVKATVPGISPATSHVEVSLGRAVARARRHDPEGDHTEVAGDLFGRRWVSGQDLGIGHIDQDPNQAPSLEDRPGAVSASVPEDDLRWLLQAYQRMGTSERTSMVALARRVLALPSGLRRALFIVGGRLMAFIGAIRMTSRVRGRSSLVAALRAWAHALLPRRLVAAVASRRSSEG